MGVTAGGVTGILGGRFDPPHVGHLALARTAVDHFGLEQLLVTVVAMALPGSDPVHKISIIPRGVAALGYTLQRPTEDRFLMTRDELENKMAVLLGGRAAEEVMFDHLSTGAANDLAKVTEIARGKAYFTTSLTLGQYIMMDFLRKRRKRAG